MYKYIAVSSLALIIGLGFFFNWPRDVQSNSVAQIAPEFANIQGYINTHPITLEKQHGYVVFLHFWRYECPECVKDLPFLNYIYQKYYNYGLKVISIHAPQYQEETSQVNVQNFVTQNNIKYPVLLDNTRATWNLYGDSYWPKDTIVDKNGYIVSSHIGTGDNYDREQAIRTALTMTR